MKATDTVSNRLADAAKLEVPLSVISRLRRLATTAPSAVEAPQEKCDFCGRSIPTEHRHFADLAQMKFLCACEMCAVLQAERGEFKPLPQRYLRLDDFQMPDDLWGRFEVPVDMAFFTFSSAHQRVVAFYPAPTGATESELRLEAWEQVVAMNPVLRELTPDLAALLVNRTNKASDYFLVPIDTCYHLVGLMRSSWHGISGGSEALEAIGKFFDELKASTTCPT